MKIFFSTRAEALDSASEYMEQVTLTFAPMQPYWCNRHQAWHIGHDYKGRNQNGDARLRSLPRGNPGRMSEMPETLLSETRGGQED